LTTQATKEKTEQTIEPGELDKVPPGYWAAIANGRVIAWAKTLKELREIMERKGYKRDEYGVIKVPSHDLLVV